MTVFVDELPREVTTISMNAPTSPVYQVNLASMTTQTRTGKSEYLDDGLRILRNFHEALEAQRRRVVFPLLIPNPSLVFGSGQLLAVDHDARVGGEVRVECRVKVLLVGRLDEGPKVLLDPVRESEDFGTRWHVVNV